MQINSLRPIQNENILMDTDNNSSINIKNKS